MTLEISKYNKQFENWMVKIDLNKKDIAKISLVVQTKG